MTTVARSGPGRAYGPVRHAFLKLCAAGILGAATGPASAQPFHPAVDKFFASEDPFIKGTILPNIEKNRKSDAKLVFAGPDGKALAGVKVSVKQVEHLFPWGAVPPFERNAYDTPEMLKKWRDIFNFGIAEYIHKWQHIEKARGVRDYTTSDRVINAVVGSGARFEYHFLTGYRPAWVDSIPTAEKIKAQEDFALATIERYKDKVYSFQVYNEDFFTHIDGGKVFTDQTQFFKRLKDRYPQTILGVNDCFRWHLKTFPTPAEAKAKWPGIDFVGQHGHNPGTYWASPQRIYGLYDPYINSGVDIHLEEFGIHGDQPMQGDRTGTWTEALKTEYFVQTFSTFFSHPAVGAFNMWGMGPHINRWNMNYLLDTTGAEKPSYAAIKSLLRDKFMTRLSGNTDASGAYRYRGFRGAYDVTVEKDGKVGTVRLDLGKEALNRTLKVIEGPAGLVIENGDGVPVSLQDAIGKTGGVPALEISAGPGLVVFTGLRQAKSLEIMDAGGRLVRAWDVIGDRIEWDRKDHSGRAAARGGYVVRGRTLEGRAFAKTVSLH